jgi:hypothetical protein
MIFIVTFTYHLNETENMEAIHEYNYTAKGFTKYVIEYTITGYDKVFTCKEFAKSDKTAKAKVLKNHKGVKINFISSYAC